MRVGVCGSGTQAARLDTYSGVMAEWLPVAIDRLPPRARRIVVAATAVLLLAGAITSLTLEATRGGGAHRRTPNQPRPSRAKPARPRLSPVSPPPVSATQLHAARVAALRFLVSYLKFASGRASAGAVEADAAGLRSQLIRQRARVTPAEHGRRPQVLSLATVGSTPGFVVATAIIEDGGVAAYRLRFTLQEHTGRWLVSSVQEG